MRVMSPNFPLYLGIKGMNGVDNFYVQVKKGNLSPAFFCFLTSLRSCKGDNFLIMHQPTSYAHVVHLKPVASELLRRGHKERRIKCFSKVSLHCKSLYFISADYQRIFGHEVCPFVFVSVCKSVCM